MVLLIIVSVLPGVRFIKSTEYKLSVENFTEGEGTKIFFTFPDRKNMAVRKAMVCCGNIWP